MPVKDSFTVCLNTKGYIDEHTANNNIRITNNDRECLQDIASFWGLFSNSITETELTGGEYDGREDIDFSNSVSYILTAKRHPSVDEKLKHREISDVKTALKTLIALNGRYHQAERVHLWSTGTTLGHKAEFIKNLLESSALNYWITRSSSTGMSENDEKVEYHIPSSELDCIEWRSGWWNNNIND